MRRQVSSPRRPKSDSGAQPVYEALRRLPAPVATPLPPWAELPAWHRRVLEASGAGIELRSPEAVGEAARETARALVDTWLAAPFDRRTDAAADLVARVAAELAWRDALLVALRGEGGWPERAGGDGES